MKRFNSEVLAYLGVAAFATLALVYLLGPDLSRVNNSEGQASDVLYFFGVEGEVVAENGADSNALDRARVAFGETGYHGAYAEGPNNRIGVWTDAHSLRVAKDYALAACGEGCELVATVQPKHRQSVEGDTNLNFEIAQAMGHQWPFSGREYLARGGANAWGYGHASGKTAGARAKAQALENCDIRLAQEAAPDGVEVPSCRWMRLTDYEDERPKPDLYPAAYTIELATLVPVEDSVVQSHETDVLGLWRSLFASSPNGLHGASAYGPDRAYAWLDDAGWPEAGQQIALKLCDIDRDVLERSCEIVETRVPTDPLHTGELAVSPELFASYQAWKNTGGAGAFAISALGAWGSSYDHADQESAIQKAADWCLYYNRRTTRAFLDLERALIDEMIPCRIVAMRGTTG